jgi:phosphopantothenoylcysteine decarboxylase/phosphopantothenate--cysteine ligase
MSLLPLGNKQILLGVTGSIAAYKAADLASKLTQAGAVVNAILTPAAEKFVTPLTFQSVTGQPAYTDADLWGAQAHVIHINISRAANMLVVAPASANTIARMVHGIADNLLCLAALAFGTGSSERPLVLAPAMDGGMYQHPSTQENLRLLEERGAIIIGPEAGHLASGLMALGRMTEPQDLSGSIRYILTRQGPLSGRRVVVTAGGTQEPLDPVRVLTNRSSGKQGFALAQAALDSGAEVTLIATPVVLPAPKGIEYLPVETASEMEEAVLKSCQTADVLIMAAAVADFRPVKVASHKIKKGSGVPTLTLEHTSDILASVADQRENYRSLKTVVGFAAETEDLLVNAQAKLKAKGLDMIVANNINAPGAGFGTDTNRVTLLTADGKDETTARAKRKWQNVIVKIVDLQMQNAITDVPGLRVTRPR